MNALPTDRTDSLYTTHEIIRNETSRNGIGPRVRCKDTVQHSTLPATPVPLMKLKQATVAEAGRAIFVGQDGIN